MNRRELLLSGVAVVALKVIPAASAQTASKDVLQILSGESRFAPLPGHEHFLNIPLSAIKNPPEDGLTLSTTKAFLHWHKVKLTKYDLEDVAAGKTVRVEDTVRDHYYEIKLK